MRIELGNLEADKQSAYSVSPNRWSGGFKSRLQ